MDKLELLRRFVSVADTGSFTETAERLNLPKSAVSSSISKLEEHLNSRLLHRSTRRITLTEAGKALLPQANTLLAEMIELENRFQQQNDTLSGLIRMDMPSRFFASVVLPHLSDWYAQHPNTQIRLIGADHRIDPIKEQVDILVRAGKLEDSDLIARPLGTMSMVNCASPGYLNHHGTPVTIDDLPSHYVVDYSPGHSVQPDGFDYVDSHGKLQSVPVANQISVSTTDAYLGAALHGLGIIQLPRAGVAGFLASGELVEVLPEYVCEPMPVAMLYTSRRYLPRRIDEFMNWLATRFEQYNC